MINTDYNLCRFRPSSIAVASILLALENRGNFQDFRDAWFQFVIQNFPEIDMVRRLLASHKLLGPSAEMLLDASLYFLGR